MIERERINKRAKLIRPLVVPLVLYVGFLALAVSWVPKFQNEILRYLVALLPMLPGFAIALGIVRLSAKLDEMERRILLESAAFSFILSLLLMLSLGLLKLAGGPQLSSPIIVSIMCLLLVMGKFWGNWRYR